MSDRAKPAPATALGGVYDRRSSSRRTIDLKAFDPLTASLEPGISLVEASAGTGKTYCITLTVLRLLLESAIELDQILVVTFTNAATDELITRVRKALRDAVEVFSGVVTQRSEKNESLFRLFDAYGSEGLDRLRRALARIDQLSIFTIHGFCKRVLEESALESGTPYNAGFLEDDALLFERAAQDWWRRTVYENPRLAALTVRHGWTHDAFLKDLKKWRRWPDTVIEPEETLGSALGALEKALAKLDTLCKSGAVRQWLSERTWLSKAPLRDARLSDRAASDPLVLAQYCNGVALLKESVLSKKDPAYKSLADIPLVIACDEIIAAESRVLRALRASCLREVDRGFDQEKRRRHLLGFDDLLRRLRDALEVEGSDGQLARAIRSRYRAALIDEFQDTDPYQFPIFSKAFDGCPLFLIGDPKQAIYGFRGADVFAYLDAVNKSQRGYTLTGNWRSTKRMVDAVNRVFGRSPDAFLYKGIPFLASHAAKDPIDPLADDVSKGALHWFVVPQDGGTVYVNKGAGVKRIHRAMCREIVRLLRSKDDGGAGIEPRQIAILVRTGREGRELEKQLRKLRVPCVIAGLGNILESNELGELQRVMAGIATPQDTRAVRAALSTEIIGWDASRIASLSEAAHESEWLGIIDAFSDARQLWLRHGFMRMMHALLVRYDVVARLLAMEDGERRVTNLRHAIEFLHGVATEQRLSPEGLLVWVARAKSSKPDDADLTELRLESDADAVQIVTIHKSKGLEYDVVFCPSLWEAKPPVNGEPLVVHCANGVVFDHGSDEYAERLAAATDESLAEDVRVAYVAMTRARYRTYLAWGALQNGQTKVTSDSSALGYLLRETNVGELVASSGGVMTMDLLSDDGAAPQPWVDLRDGLPDAEVRKFTALKGQFETWRVASFTSLVASRRIVEERDVSDPSSTEMAERKPAVEDRADFMAFPAGRQAGVVLHEIFERADFGADVGALREVVSSILVRDRMAVSADDLRIDAVTRMAERVLHSPLPSRHSERSEESSVPLEGRKIPRRSAPRDDSTAFRLADIPTARTLREWKFHLPLGDIDHDSLADAFANRGDDLAKRYAANLRALPEERTRGFLTGVVDLAFERDGRWYVMDWKSNHLGREESAYEPEALEAEMFGSHYVLQYHLYVAALHRFLKMRVSGYTYESHMGGVWYAFLRGIDGSRRGWFHGRPPFALIEALDAIFDGSHAGAPA